MIVLETLPKDILKLVDNEVTSSSPVSSLAGNLEKVLQERLLGSEQQGNRKLRLSNIGEPCLRKLWYKVNQPEDAEEILPHTKIKFMYGDILELVLLDLAERAGHKVEYRQHELSLNGITGHIDAIIDGVLVDVKSASSYSFKKFQDGLRPDDDAFGYLGQIKSYLSVAGQAGLCEKNKAAFLVIDKVTGNIHLDVHHFSNEELLEWEKIVKERRRTVENDFLVPDRGFEDVPEGKSGNRKLNVNCSYCPFKKICWPNLRVFLYSGKPVFLTEVQREPRVPEIEI